MERGAVGRHRLFRAARAFKGTRVRGGRAECRLGKSAQATGRKGWWAELCTPELGLKDEAAL